jgi:hypothetical protein
VRVVIPVVVLLLAGPASAEEPAPVEPEEPEVPLVPPAPAPHPSGGVEGGVIGLIGQKVVVSRQTVVRPWEDVTVTRRIEPWRAAVARAPGTSCTVELDVDVDGKPTSVRVSACPAAFEARVRRVVGRWRFDPFWVRSGVLAPFRTSTQVEVPSR